MGILGMEHTDIHGTTEVTLSRLRPGSQVLADSYPALQSLLQFQHEPFLRNAGWSRKTALSSLWMAGADGARILVTGFRR